MCNLQISVTIDEPDRFPVEYAYGNMAPSSSGPGQMVLSHQIEGSNPFGATIE